MNLLFVKEMFDFVYNQNLGIGDCLSVFNTNLPVWSPSPHYAILRKYTSLTTLDTPIGNGLDVTSLHDRDMSHHHLFNRVRIATGVDPIKNPRAILDLIEYRPKKDNIAFSFDAGRFASGQHHFHTRPRQLYDEHKQTVQEFISANCDKFNFIEIGLQPSGFNNSLNLTDIGLEKTIDILSVCCSYFGMHSGMMHLATAIGVPCTIVINFPTIDRIYSNPAVHNSADKVEWEKQWLYPQHRYLHEDVINSKYAITVENLSNVLQ